MATLQEKLEKAERDRKEAQERMQMLRKEIKKQEAREKREQERKAREELRKNREEVGAFVLDYLAPWLVGKSFKVTDEFGNKVKCSVWEKFSIDNEDAQIPSILLAVESRKNDVEENSEEVSEEVTIPNDSEGVGTPEGCSEQLAEEVDSYSYENNDYSTSYGE